MHFIYLCVVSMHGILIVIQKTDTENPKYLIDIGKVLNHKMQFQSN